MPGALTTLGQVGGTQPELCATRGINKTTAPVSYKCFRFPQAIIAHAVWLSHRFALRFRHVEELHFARGFVGYDEPIRQWCKKFGQVYANAMRSRRSEPGDTSHLDEVFLTINGKRHYLWRAVDQAGTGFDILVQNRQGRRREVLPQAGPRG